MGGRAVGMDGWPDSGGGSMDGWGGQALRVDGWRCSCCDRSLVDEYRVLVSGYARNSIFYH